MKNYKKSSIKTKMNFYKNNGTGRDTYITSNCGGLLADYNFLNNKPVGYFNFKREFNIKAIRNDPKVFKYYCNGVGREGYIVKNPNGLIKDLTSLKNKENSYLSNLRNYNSDINSDFNYVKNKFKAKNKISNSKKYNTINLKNLSKPKRNIPIIKEPREFSLISKDTKDKFLKAYQTFLL